MSMEDSSRSLGHKGSNFFSNALHFEIPTQYLLSFCVAVTYKLTIGFSSCYWIKTWVKAYILTVKQNVTDKWTRKDCITQNRLIWTVLIRIVYLKRMSPTHYNRFKFTPDLIREHKVKNIKQKRTLRLQQSPAPPN